MFGAWRWQGKPNANQSTQDIVSIVYSFGEFSTQNAEKSNPTNIARATKLLGRILAAIEVGLGDKDYLVGDFTAADVMCGHATIVATRNGGDISDKPIVAAYVERLQARPALQKSWDVG